MNNQCTSYDFNILMLYNELQSTAIYSNTIFDLPCEKLQKLRKATRTHKYL
jgi:conjugal transfer/entry exclusion protein